MTPYACTYGSASWDVQLGHLIALIGIGVRQNGHSLVVGSSAGFSFGRCSRLICRMIK